MEDHSYWRVILLAADTVAVAVAVAVPLLASSECSVHAFGTTAAPFSDTDIAAGAVVAAADDNCSDQIYHSEFPHEYVSVAVEIDDRLHSHSPLAHAVDQGNVPRRAAEHPARVYFESDMHFERHFRTCPG